MPINNRRAYEVKKNVENRILLKRLIYMTFIFSVFLTALIYIGKLYGMMELYFAVLVYTIILVFFGYLSFLNYESKSDSQMKALVKKEGIISGELVLINTEEKLKNILSLEFERCFNNNSESAIIFFDVDQLGEVNRNYGYNTGDQIIIEIILSTKRFISESALLQNSGAVLARVKGDTFALLMPNITEKGGYLEAEKLKTVIQTLRLGIEEPITCRF
ncbi:MAG TPA: hypothetical protein DCS67_01565, partial [Clostridiales bacterium UBA8960]|nr:hypothetical protein [Clostridiales bacterium UBA8960]